MIPVVGKYLKGAQFLLIGALTCDPVLTRLFTPLHPQLGTYEVCTDARPLAAVARDWERSSAAPELAPNSAERRRVQHGDVESVEPLDVFGMVGTYDHAAVVRLYGGRRVQVVRGWKTDGDRFESVTLVSPYPDASLSRLEPGTMVITFRLRRS
jgi:hypothetical protein